MVLRFVLFGYRSVGAVTLQGMGKSISLPTTTERNPKRTVCIIPGMYSGRTDVLPQDLAKSRSREIRP